MPIQFRCPHCRNKISVSRKQSGEELECPSCTQLVDVPVIETSPPRESKPDDEPLDFEVEETIEEKAEDLFPDDFFTDDESGAEETVEPAPEDEPSEVVADFASEEEEDEEEDFAIRKADTEFEELDLTPMVDVTFLLLIFFMISASFSLQKTMQFPPPEPNEDGATHSMQEMEDLEKESIQIEVDENNTILVDDVPVDDPALLAEVIADKASASNQQEILLTAHEQALHDTVVWVFDSANAAGIQAIRIITSTE